MKIREGFISNSSSCSFIVSVPPKYKLTESDKEMINKKVQENKTPVVLDEVIEKVQSVLDLLNRGYYRGSEDNWDEEEMICGLVLSVIDRNKWIHEFMDDGPDNVWNFINILTPKNIEILKGLLK